MDYSTWEPLFQVSTKYSISSQSLVTDRNKSVYNQSVRNNITLNNLKMPFLLFILAFLLRFIYIHEFSKFPTFYHLDIDQEYYHLWAKSIVKDGFGGKDIFEMTPLYAYFLAFIIRFFTENLYIIRLIQVLIGSLTVVLIYKIADNLFMNRRIAIVAGLAAAFYGTFILYDGMIMKTFLAVFFAVLTLYWLTKKEEERPIKYLFPGIFIGLMALVRENAILLILGIPLCLIIKEDKKWIASKKSLAFILGAFLVILPVTLRNYWVGKEFVLITTGGGEVFYIGNYEQADGTYKPPPFLKTAHPLLEHEEFRQEAMKRAGRQLTRKEYSDFWFKEGFRAIGEDPKRFLYLMYRKFIIFWNFYERPDNQNFYFMKVSTTSLKFTLGFGIIAPLGIIGLFLSLKNWKRFLIPYAFLFVYMISVLIFFNYARFRVPAVPILIIFAASYIDWLYSSLKVKRISKSFISIVLLILLFLGVNYRIDGIDPYKLYFPTEYSKLGKSYMLEGILVEAKKAYYNAVEMDSNSIEGHFGLGRIALKEGKLQDAVNHFQKTITIEPDNYRGYMNLAIVYKELGRINEAQSMLETAVKLNPNIWRMKSLSSF